MTVFFPEDGGATFVRKMVVNFYQTCQRVERRKSEEERKGSNVTEKKTAAAFVCESL
jgi:hypothetical protein